MKLKPTSPYETTVLKSAPRFIRIKTVNERTGIPISSIYYLAQQGLFVSPVKLGARMSAWIESEVEAVMNARIAGQTTEQIKTLVQELETNRAQVAEVKP